MPIKDVRYVFDISNGQLNIFLSENLVVKYTHYNSDTVTIGTDANNDIVFISIYGFRDYASRLIDEYIKKVIAPLIR